MATQPASAQPLTVHRTTLREQTLNTLREAILGLRFRPGQRLVERELCELTGVSRTCVREALRSLESECLVTTTPHKGPVVASLTAQDAAQIYEVRAVLEGLAGRLFAVRASDDQVMRLSDAVASYEQAIRKKDVHEVLESLETFYGMLFTGAGNDIAASMSQSLRARVHYLRATTTIHHTDADTRRSVRSFRKIVACAKRRDAEQTSEACINQVLQAAKTAARILAASNPQ